MSGDTRIERQLPLILADLGAGPSPDYAQTLLARTAATAQRPGWVFPERWFPMSALTERMATVPRFPMRAAIAVALLILALVAAAVFVGSQQRRLPAPFGPAANGQIVYADTNGDIFVGDPVAGTSTAIVTGPTKDTRPVFSPDGTKVAFLRDNETAIVVVGADGSDVRVVTTEPLRGVSYMGWSPDNSSVVVGTRDGTMAFDIERPGKPRALAESAATANDFNTQMSQLFRPPDGEQVLRLSGDGSAATISLADADGSNERLLLDPATTSLAYAGLGIPVWSPDGSMIAFEVQTDSGGSGHIYLMNADGSGLRELQQGSLESIGCRPPCGHGDSHPAWSPDGSQIAVMRWLRDTPADGPWTDWIRPITIIDVATGASREIGPPSTNGFYGWGWSPDGRSILALPDDDRTGGGGKSIPGRLLIMDVASGDVREIEWDAGSAPSWQRVAVE